MHNENAKREELSILRDFRHDIGNELSTIGSFLAFCRTLDGNEIFRNTLENAEKSYREILRKLEEIIRETQENNLEIKDGQ